VVAISVMISQSQGLFALSKPCVTRCITLKIIEEFSDAVFLGVDVESLLGEADVSSRQTRVPVRKSYNF
jgi:hypothetical protein